MIDPDEEPSPEDKEAELEAQKNDQAYNDWLDKETEPE